MRNILIGLASGVSLMGLLYLLFESPEPIQTRELSVRAAEDSSVESPSDHLTNVTSQETGDAARSASIDTASTANSGEAAELREAAIEAARTHTPIVSDIRVQAVPGIAGFEVPSMPVRNVVVALAFGADEVDPTWSTTMEAKMFLEIAQINGLSVTQLHVQCRTEMCAAIFVHSNEEGSFTEADTNGEIERLSRAVGLAPIGDFTHTDAQGTVFTTIYFRKDALSETQASKYESADA